MIRKTLLLACDPDRAFELLTRQAGAWWPPDRRHTQDPRSQIFIEPGGRFFERATDGREVELGVVRVFSPPERLVLDWYPGSGAEQPTHVEIALRAEGDGTRVELLHQAGPFSAEAYGRNQGRYEQSWGLVFEAWAQAAVDTA